MMLRVGSEKVFPICSPQLQGLCQSVLKYTVLEGLRAVLDFSTKKCFVGNNAETTLIMLIAYFSDIVVSISPSTIICTLALKYPLSEVRHSITALLVVPAHH